MKNWFKKLQFALVRIGKEKKWLKYPVTLLLAIMFAVCEISDAVKTLAYPKIRRRILASVLACCMIFTLIPTAAFAAEPVQGVPSVCTHHTGHTTECGYTEGMAGTPCGFVPDAPEEASPSNSDKPETEPTAHVHNEECGYIEAVDGVPCGFVCDVCDQLPEQKDCNCLPVDSGEVTHGEDCPLYLPAQSDCICPPVDSGELTHGEDCPLYEKLVPEQADAVKNVLALIDALPTLDELAAQDTEGAGFADYLAKLRLDTAAARAAYNALTAEEKATFDPAVLAKLTALEEVLAAMPVLMSDAIPMLTENAGVFSYQNVKYMLNNPNGQATISGVVARANPIGNNNVLTIPAKVKKADGTIYNVTEIMGNTFSNCNLLTSVTVPSSVTTIGDSAFNGLKSGAVVTLEHTNTLPQYITGASFRAGSTVPFYVVIVDEAVANALSQLYTNKTIPYGFIVKEVPANKNFDSTNTANTLKVETALPCPTLGRYDVLGLKDGAEIQTTYYNTSAASSGYFTYLSTDASPAFAESSLVRLPGEGAETSVKDGIWVKVNTEFISDGKYLRVTYTLRNSTGDDISVVSLGVNADVQIATDDSASIYPTPTGFRMVNTETLGNGVGMQFTLNCKNAPGADDVRTMWYGAYGTKDNNLFTDLKDKTELTDTDSGLAFSWQGMHIPAGESISKSVVFGVGEEATPPALPADGSKPIALYLTANGQKDITVNAKVTDTTGVTDTLYYTINGGTEQTLGETITADGSEQVIFGNIAASNFAVDGTYTVKLWIMNSKGAMSEVITKVLMVSSGAMGGAGLETGSAPVSPGGGTPPAADKITITINDAAAEYSGTDLMAAIGEGTALSTIKKLTVTKGEMVADDWNVPVCLTALTHFTIAEGVMVADMPDLTSRSIFPKSIVNVIIPQAIKIGEWAFMSCEVLETASIPKATSIGTNAFTGCPKLTTANFPAATSIGANAFTGCWELTTASFPAATSIGEAAFDGCSKLETVDFSKAESIGVGAFAGCTSLATASFPKVTSIGNGAFYNCTSLATLKLPATPPITVGVDAFVNCLKTTLAFVDGSGNALAGTDLATAQENYDKVADGIADSTTTDGLWYGWKVREPAAAVCTCTVSAPTFADGSITIPADQASATHVLTATGSALNGSCTMSGHSSTIIAYSFAEKTDTGNIASIAGSTLTVTGAGSVVITATATVNGQTATSDATFAVTKAAADKITITVTDGTTTKPGISGTSLSDAIAKSTLTANTITELTITAGEVATADWTYLGRLSVLTDFTIDAGIADGKVANIPDLSSSGTFPRTIVNATIPQEITIDNNAFNSCQALKTVNIPKATSIGKEAFISCKALKTATFPKVITIGASAFQNCTMLESVSFPAATSIGEAAFRRCSVLNDINLPQVARIDNGAFRDCAALVTAEFPLAALLSNDAFNGCMGLKSVSFPLLGVVPSSAFKDCTALETASFPKAIMIQESAFSGCTLLSTLNLGATVPTSIKATTFAGCPAGRSVVIMGADSAALATAKAAYDKKDYFDTGSDTDGLWFGWKITGEAVATVDAITIKINDAPTEYGGASLSAAVATAGGTSAVTKLTITKGEVATADWEWFSSGGTNSPMLSALTDFTIDVAVTKVENIPDRSNASFPTTIVNVNIPQAIQIGNNTFSRCVALTGVNIPAATSINNYAFLECTALKNVNFPAAASIGTQAFYKCSALVSVNAPLVTSIGYKAFESTALASVIFAKVENIKQEAFYGCNKLITASFPAVTEIGFSAFKDCTTLGTLKLGATPPTVTDTGAFIACPANRSLTLVNASGAELTGADLTTAQTNYDKVADGMFGTTATDGKWYGWTLKSDTPAFTPINGGVSFEDGNIYANGNALTVIKATRSTNIYYTNDPDKTPIDLSGVNDPMDTMGSSQNGYKLSWQKDGRGVGPTLFGGSKTANVGDVELNLLGGELLMVCGSGGSMAEASSNAQVGDITINIGGGPGEMRVNRSVYAAGYNGKVTGNIKVNVAVGGIVTNLWGDSPDVTATVSTTITGGEFDHIRVPSLTIGGGIMTMASDSRGIIIKCGTETQGVEKFAIAADLENDVNVTLAAGYTGGTIATGAVESDVAKIKLVGAGAVGATAKLVGTDIVVTVTPVSPEAEWTPTGGVKASGTLLDGFAALKTTGGTIKLVADITKTQDFSGTLFVIDTDYLKPIIFDLAGNKLAFTGGNQSTALFFVQGNTGLFTITDSSAGKTGGISMVNGFAVCADKTAKLALSGGTYTASGSMGDEFPVLGAIALLGSDDNFEEQKATLNSFCVQGFVFSPATLSFDAVTAAMHTAATVKVVPVAPIAVTGVTLNKTTLSLAAGKSETLTATIAPATATNTAVTWSSSNPANATVDANGKVTALTAGSTTITVTTTDGGKKATCAVTVTAATSKPAPGGKLEAPLTQDKVNDVFGEGNATLDGTTTPPTIKLEKDITPEKPIEIETDVIIDLGGNTITGKPGETPIIVGGGDKVTIDGSGTIAGGDSTTGTGGNGITGGTGSEITIGSDVIISGGDGTTGGDGINSGGNVTVGGDVSGGNGSAGNSGDGVDTSTGSGNITIDNGGSASGGNGGNGSAGTGGNGGNGTNSGSGSTTVDGETTGGSGGNGTTGGGSGGDGSTSTGGGSITVDGETTGGSGGNASSGTGGNGGDGSETSGNTDINSGGSSTGGAGGNGSVTGGNGGSGTSGGNVNVDGGGTTTGGTGGSGSATGGNGGNGTDGNNTTINGGTTGGNGGNGNGNGSGGNGGNGANQGSGTVGGNGSASGGDGGNGAGTGNGGNGGAGIGGGAGAGSVTTKPGAKGRKATAEVDDSKSGTTVTVPNESKLADAALTEAEKKDPAITEVKVVLNVEKKNNQPDKAEIDRVLSSEAANTIGAFFDITLDKIITNAGGAQPPVGVANASEEIEITITIPSDMRGGSNYVVIRVHNGTGAALSTTQSGDNLTFKTDKFSTYAIAYTKTGGTTPPTPPSGGDDNSGGSGGSYTPPITVTPSDKPNMPTTAETEIKASVDKNGNAAVTLPVDTVEAAVKKAVDEAKKAGKIDHGIAVVINVSTGGSNTSSMSVNLPKATQEYIIGNKVSQITFVVKSPAISMGLNLAAVTDINRQAQADVQLTATRLTNTTGMSAAAKAAIGTRPVFALSATYQNGTKAISNVGSGMIAVAIPYTPSSKENTGNLYAVYADEHGEVNYLTESSYNATNKAVIFSASHFRTYAGGYKAIAFTDISGHWAKDHIEFAANRGLLLDIDTNIFSPNTPMTRAMFVTALGRLAGIDSTKYKISTFTDVKADAYYAPYVTWAAEKNIVNGTTATIFAPDQAITRQEMAVIMQNYAKAMNYTVPKTREPVIFEDNGGIGSWAAEAVKAMQMAGVITGKDGNKFDPTGTATRAEVAAVLHRYVELVIDKATAQGLDINDSGKIVYYENGKLFTGTKTIDGTTYHFGSDGICTETDAVVPKTEKYITHIMVYGDTLWKLSRKHKCTVAEIVGMNGIKDPNNVPVGTKIKIPQK